MLYHILCIIYDVNCIIHVYDFCWKKIFPTSTKPENDFFVGQILCPIVNDWHQVVVSL